MTPVYYIAFSGKPWSTVYQDRILSIDITDNDGMEVDSLSIKLDDRDYLVPTPEMGEEIWIELGYLEWHLSLEKKTFMGLFIVNEISYGLSPKSMTIRAKSADMKESLKEPKTRDWHETTLGDIATTIAEEHHLIPAINSDLAGIAFPHINQSEESDMHLLTRLVGNHDGMHKIANGKLIIVPKGEGKAATGRSLSNKLLHFNQLTTGGTINRKTRSDYKGVKAKWRHPGEAKTHVEKEGEGAPFFEIRDPAPNQALAKHKAQSKLKQLKRGTGSISLTMMGNASFAAGIRVTLGQGFKPEYEGSQWILTRVTHRFNNSSFTTTIEGELPNEVDNSTPATVTTTANTAVHALTASESLYSVNTSKLEGEINLIIMNQHTGEPETHTDYIITSASNKSFNHTGTTDDKGGIRITGIPVGEYTLRFGDEEIIIVSS